MQQLSQDETKKLDGLLKNLDPEDRKIIEAKMEQHDVRKASHRDPLLLWLDGSVIFGRYFLEHILLHRGISFKGMLATLVVHVVQNGDDSPTVPFGGIVASASVMLLFWYFLDYKLRYGHMSLSEFVMLYGWSDLIVIVVFSFFSPVLLQVIMRMVALRNMPKAISAGLFVSLSLYPLIFVAVLLLILS